MRCAFAHALFQFGVELAHLLLGALLLGDVKRESDRPRELPRGRLERIAEVHHPSIFTVAAAEPVLDLLV